MFLGGRTLLWGRTGGFAGLGGSWLKEVNSRQLFPGKASHINKRVAILRICVTLSYRGANDFIQLLSSSSVALAFDGTTLGKSYEMFVRASKDRSLALEISSFNCTYLNSVVLAAYVLLYYVALSFLLIWRFALLMTEPRFPTIPVYAGMFLVSSLRLSGKSPNYLNSRFEVDMIVFADDKRQRERIDENATANGPDRRLVLTKDATGQQFLCIGYASQLLDFLGNSLDLDGLEEPLEDEALNMPTHQPRRDATCKVM